MGGAARRVSHVVAVGGIPMGATHPIRIQSMTTTDTMDTQGTVDQVVRLADAGCDYVRLTVPNVAAATHLAVLKKRLQACGCSVPLVADVHFTPAAAEIAARYVEKVRINPGNYTDNKRFATVDTSADVYAAALDRLRAKLLPLLQTCQDHGTALRIGTNHGSLSDRIMSKYGDTPLGMVESALEFVRICEDVRFDAIVLSMKSSQPQVMVHAYRLLSARLAQGSHLPYPLHLGVTEAGDGLTGRMKSALGIGTLLAEGLGDTIRVSLTEAPEREVPVAQALCALTPPQRPPQTTMSYDRIPTHGVNTAAPQFGNIPLNHLPPRVIIQSPNPTTLTPDTLGYGSDGDDAENPTEQRCDYYYTPTYLPLLAPVSQIIPYTHYAKAISAADAATCLPYVSADAPVDWVHHIAPDQPTLLEITAHTPIPFHYLAARSALILVIEAGDLAATATQLNALRDQGYTHPIVLRYTTECPEDELPIRLGAHLGPLLLDGHGDALWINYPDPAVATTQAFILLQAARLRITETDYIACPSCGRTLFDLEQTTHLIREATAHLKGLKIAIMGCIVNGPGEMADADYGYVGVGKGKITLYRGKTIVQRGIDSDHAVDALIDLIKADDKWTEPAK